MKRNEVVKTINNLKGEEGHQKVLEVYNSQKPLPRNYKLQYKDPWCAATVSAVFLMNGYNALSEVSCTMMTKKAKDLGIWVEDDAYVPQIGDVIMYDWQDDGKGDNEGNPDHVGIVIKVTGKKITVREGNKGGTVGNRSIDANGKFIRGYIVPPYEDDSGILDGEIANTSHAEGQATYASTTCAHAEGVATSATGQYSHAEEATSIASGMCSHAEGSNTTASGYYAHAEGFRTEASGKQSHAEGSISKASGVASHAEGSGVSSGYYAHAEGFQTTANHKS